MGSFERGGGIDFGGSWPGGIGSEGSVTSCECSLAAAGSAVACSAAAGSSVAPSIVQGEVDRSKVLSGAGRDVMPPFPNAPHARLLAALLKGEHCTGCQQHA